MISKQSALLYILLLSVSSTRGVNPGDACPFIIAKIVTLAALDKATRKKTIVATPVGGVPLLTNHELAATATNGLHTTYKTGDPVEGAKDAATTFAAFKAIAYAEQGARYCLGHTCVDNFRDAHPYCSKIIHICSYAILKVSLDSAIRRDRN